MTEPGTYPLAKAVHDKAVQKGAYARFTFSSQDFDFAILRTGSDEQVLQTDATEHHAMEWADFYIGLRGLAPPIGYGGPGYERRSALLRRVRGNLSTLRWQRTRWLIVRVPTSSYAHYIGRSTAQFLDEFFDACFVSEDMIDRWRRLPDRFNRANEVRIVSADTDLRFSVAGRTWVTFSGELNLPDGEIATAPVTSTVNGHISFPERAVFGAHVVRGLELEWKAGRLVSHDAQEGGEFVEQLLTLDDGAARIGEFGIGLNHTLSQWTEDLFFDEKILGTIHIALGRAYAQCGGTNRSALHWDIVKDLRSTSLGGGGQVFVDDVSIVDNGAFLMLENDSAKEETCSTVREQ